jgi:hypothetical protein
LVRSKVTFEGPATGGGGVVKGGLRLLDGGIRRLRGLLRGLGLEVEEDILKRHSYPDEIIT